MGSLHADTPQQERRNAQQAPRAHEPTPRRVEEVEDTYHEAHGA